MCLLLASCLGNSSVSEYLWRREKVEVVGALRSDWVPNEKGLRVQVIVPIRFEPPNQDIQSENFERTILENLQQKSVLLGSHAEHLVCARDQNP